MCEPPRTFVSTPDTVLVTAVVVLPSPAEENDAVEPDGESGVGGVLALFLAGVAVEAAGMCGALAGVDAADVELGTGVVRRSIAAMSEAAEPSSVSHSASENVSETSPFIHCTSNAALFSAGAAADLAGCVGAGVGRDVLGACAAARAAITLDTTVAAPSVTTSANALPLWAGLLGTDGIVVEVEVEVEAVALTPLTVCAPTILAAEVAGLETTLGPAVLLGCAGGVGDGA